MESIGWLGILTKESLKNNVINTVGNAQDRFDEDPLRKIRAIRFAAKMGAKIPDDVVSAIYIVNLDV